MPVRFHIYAVNAIAKSRRRASQHNAGVITHIGCASPPNFGCGGNASANFHFHANANGYTQSNSDINLHTNFDAHANEHAHAKSVDHDWAISSRV